MIKMFSSTTVDVIITINDGEAHSVTTGAGNDTVNLAYGTLISCDMGAGNDTVYLGTSGVSVSAWSLWGGAGVDVLHLGSSVTLNGGGFSAASSGFEELLCDPSNNVYGDGGPGTFDFSGFFVLGSYGIHFSAQGGDDIVVGTSLADTLYGGNGSDLLVGGLGNDYLDGEFGADRLAGSAGNDTYVVDDLLDEVTEFAGDGADTVLTTLSAYTLGASVENLTYVGNTNFGGSGNELDNVITSGAGKDMLSGGAGNDRLDGGSGADSFVGGTGNDTFMVDNGGDAITENENEGIDSVRTTLSTYTLGANLENLTYTSSGSFTGNGNSLDNNISSGAGADTLTGGGGSDWLDSGTGVDSLAGGTGNDTYVVDNVGDVVFENASEGTDTVRTSLSAYTLGNAVENLIYTAYGSFTGTGNALNNSITGNSGNDTLHAGAGDDILSGNAGNDALYGEAGNDNLNAGSGTNSVYGGDGDDTIVTENNGNDVVDAGTGNDTVNVAYGVLLSCAMGDGDDTLYLGTTGSWAAASSLSGGAGTDVLRLGSSAYLNGVFFDSASSGFERLQCDAANTVYGDGNSSTFDFSTFTTVGTYGIRFLAQGGADTVTGTALADWLSGGDGNDTLYGGAGNDTLASDAGNDTLFGGEGSDTFNVDGGGTDTVSAGTGNDIANIAYSVVASCNLEDGDDTLYLGTTGGTVTVMSIAGGAGTDLLRLGSSVYWSGTTLSAATIGFEQLQCDASNLLYGTSSVDTYDFSGFTMVGTIGVHLLAQAGDDTITGSTAADSLSGGDGNDTLYGGDGNDTLNGNAGTDALDGGTGNDTFNVTGSDTVIAGTGDDTINLTHGVLSSADQGDGNDTVYLNSGPSSITATLLSGGAGTDLLRLGNGSSYSVTLNTTSFSAALTGFEQLQCDQYNHAYGTSVADTFDFSGFAMVGTYGVHFSSQGGDDVVTGTTLDDTLSGSEGNDTLYGGTGNDQLNGDNGNDTLYGDVGDDALSGGAGTNTVYGGDGNDTLYGNSGTDTLNGEAGNDTFNLNNSGSSVVVGGVGDDTINLTYGVLSSADQGDGNDTVYLNSGPSSITATLLSGGAGTDLLRLGNGSSYSVTLNTTSFSAALTGFEQLQCDQYNHAYGTSVADTFDFSGFAMVGTYGVHFSSQGGDDVVTGTTLDDTLSGSEGNDTLYGGTGNDQLNGDNGNDTLYGGSGGDRLVGGTGDDNYEVDSALDTVVEYASAGIDTVRASLASYTLTSNVENLTYTGSGNFAGTGNTSNNIVTGGSGNDTLDGGTGVDTLVGGAGDDTYVVDTAADVITENAGEGVDTARTALTSYTLGAYVENLIYTGSGAFTGTGNGLDNLFMGGAGNDTFDGGNGSDTISYRTATGGVTVVLGITTAQVIGGGQGTDTLASIENAIGSGYADTITGNTGNNVIMGGGGDDILDGGAGVDTADYSDATSGVTVSLAVAGAQSVGGGLGADTLSNFENLIGSSFADTLTGSGGNNMLTCGSGNDVLLPGLGDDTVSGGDGDDSISFVEGTLTAADRIDGGSGTDTVVLNGDYSGANAVVMNAATITNVEVLTIVAGYSYELTTNDATVGSGQTLTLDGSALASANALNLNGAAETDGSFAFIGGAGNDILRGGSGSDTVDYTRATGGVTVNLTLATAQAVGGGMGSDTLNGIENLIGSGYADTLIGDGGNNSLNGGGGADSLRPGMGTDTVSGGNGDDTISFTGGRFDASDTIDGGAGNDFMWLTGDYSGGVVMNAATLTNVDSIAVAGGFNYSLTTADAAVGAGQQLSVDATSLGASNALYFNGSAETDGTFTLLTGAGADTLIGGGGIDTFRSGGGFDHVSGNGGNDTISFSLGHLDAADVIDGGTGTDLVWLNSDYTGANAVTFNATTMANVETIGLSASYSYNLTTADGTVTAAAQLTVDGSSLGSSKTLSFNGSAETDGSFLVIGGAGADTIIGGSGNDTLSGRAGNDTLRAGFGNDVAFGGDGDDTISFTGGRLNASDIIDGGTGTDFVWLNGDYTGANAVNFFASTMTNVESIGFAACFNYTLKTSDGTVASGKVLTLDASGLGASNALTFDGSAETNGTFTFISGSGGDGFTGGSGADILKYDAASRSTGLHYDTINALNFANDSFDIPGGTGVVTGIEAAKTTGTLSTASIDSDLFAALTGLGAHHAILFTPDAGTLSGQTFLVVDCNGTAGYQAGQDLVIRLNGYSGTLAAGAFH